MKCKIIHISPTTIIVFLLFALGFLLRVNHLKAPPLDFHSSRQLRSALISRAMYYEMNPASDPATRSLAIELASDLEAYEPPIFERLVALVYLVIGSEQLWVARMMASLAWLIGGWFLYRLACRGSSAVGGVTALAFYLVLPFGVVASRAFQPDPVMTAAVLAASWCIYSWLENPSAFFSWKWTLSAGIVTGTAVLIKAMAAFPLAAVALLSVVFSGVLIPPPSTDQPDTHRRYLLRSFLRLGAASALMALIPALYYLVFFPGDAGSFMSFWTGRLSSLLLTTRFYLRWLDLIRGLIDPGVVFLAFLGIFALRNSTRVIGLGLWVGYGLLGLVFPFQIYTHEYYSLLLVPAVGLGLAPITASLWEKLNAPRAAQPMEPESDPQPGTQNQAAHSRLWISVFLFAALAILGYYAWVARSVVVATDKSSEPIPWQMMGKEIPQGSIIALTHDYGARLKYYGWRKVQRLWPEAADLQLAEASGSEPISDFEAYFDRKTEGMDYFLVTLFTSLDIQPDLKNRLQTLPVAATGDGYILFDLHTP